MQKALKTITGTAKLLTIKAKFDEILGFVMILLKWQNKKATQKSLMKSVTPNWRDKIKARVVRQDSQR